MGAQQAKPLADQLVQAQSKSDKVVKGILAWGSNSHGQCGVKNHGILLYPHELRQFRGQDVAQLSAGHRHCAVQLAGGGLYTWGLNDAGQLGVGEGGTARGPSRIFSFEGFAPVRWVSVGREHTLFVDSQGALWASGSNARGQLGFGSVLEMEMPDGDRLPPRALPDFLVRSELQQRMHAMGLTKSAVRDTVAQHLVAPVPSLLKQRELDSIRDTVAVADSVHGWRNAVAAAALGFGDPASLLQFQGISEGQCHTPLRVGRDMHPLLVPRAAEPSAADRAVSFKFWNSRAHMRIGPALKMSHRSPEELIELLGNLAGTSGGDVPPPQELLDAADAAASVEPEQSLHSEVVVKAVAGSTFSMALTGSGAVWMFGLGEHGELANGNLLQTDARPVTGRVAQLIADNGGAVDVAAGRAFCLALARNGAVVVWGKPAPEGMLATGGGLPAMTHIAAGKRHAVMSDGETVWRAMYDPHDGPALLHRPQVVRFDGARGNVAKLAAGGDASAAVDSDGRLWMWGRVASEGSLPTFSGTGKPVMPCLQEYQRSAVKCSGVGTVVDVALGANHVLASTQL